MKFDKFDFGKKRHKCRIDKKLSQTKCSEYAGISQKYLSDIERGDRVPKLETFVNILNVIEASADFVFQNSLSIGYIEKSCNIQKALEGLTNEQKDIILSVMECMIQKFKQQ